MEAHPLSSQYSLAANGGPGTNTHDRCYDGDFAAGCRRSPSQPDASPRGDFATGMRSTPIRMTIGDFATGLRNRRVAGLVQGDFATGQRAVWRVTPDHGGQPEPHVLSRVREHDTAKAA
jgi:hypothetical protein